MFPMAVTIHNIDQLNAVMRALNECAAEQTNALSCIGQGAKAAAEAAKLPDVMPEKFADIIAAAEKAGA